MRSNLFLLVVCLLLNQCIYGQQNNTLRGKMLFLNSGKTPAVGVEISGSIKKIENANTVYTSNNGTYELVFPNARVGYPVKLLIGNEDESGKSIELVNNKEVGICRIPAQATDEFEIIVCHSLR